MNVHIRPSTRQKLNELQQIIENEKGEPIGVSALIRVLIDIAYDKLIGENNGTR